MEARTLIDKEGFSFFNGTLIQVQASTTAHKVVCVNNN